MIYAGPDKGWIPASPPEPPAPEDEAQQFATAEDAQAYAAKYGIKADAVEIPI